jgi:hypothetical protein
MYKTDRLRRIEDDEKSGILKFLNKLENLMQIDLKNLITELEKTIVQALILSGYFINLTNGMKNEPGKNFKFVGK